MFFCIVFMCYYVVMNKIYKLILSFTTCIFLTLTLFSLSPRSGLSVDDYQKQKMDKDTFDDSLSILKRFVDKGDFLSFLMFRSTYPDEFYSVFHDILSYMVLRKEFSMLLFFLGKKDVFPIPDRIIIEWAWKVFELREEEVFKQMIKLCADRDISQFSFMHVAARWGDICLMKEACRYQKNVNIKDFQGQTPLHHAARFGQVLMMSMIIDRGGDLTIKDVEGDTPLHRAIKRGVISQLSFQCGFAVYDLVTKDFSYTHLMLKEEAYEVLSRFSSFNRWGKEERDKLVMTAVDQGQPFILMELLPDDFPENERERLLKKTLKICQFEKFRQEFLFFRPHKRKSYKILTEMYRIRPEILEWMDFSDSMWSDDAKMNFLDSVVQHNPHQAITLRSYSDIASSAWVNNANFLRKLLRSHIPIEALTCPTRGTALASFIQSRGLGQSRSSDDDDIIFDLIKKGMGVNEETPLGKPFNHHLYMLSLHLKNLNKEEEESSLAVVDAFLENYEKNSSSVGMSLDPEMAENLHGGVARDSVEEYMGTTLGATLIFEHPSKMLYDRIKWTVDLEELNDHGRSFIHHLALLEDGFESHLKELFLTRGYTLDEIKKWVNLPDNDGMTPLMYATRNQALFQQLLDCGADIDLTDKRGFSVAHHLMIHGSDEVIRCFIKSQNRSVPSSYEGFRLRQELGIKMDDRLTLGVTFFEQLRELAHPHRLLSGYKCPERSRRAILSTHPQFSLILDDRLRSFMNDIESYKNKKSFFWDQLSMIVHGGVEYLKENVQKCMGLLKKDDASRLQREEERADLRARVFLSTGMSSSLLDGASFVTETYGLLNPFHVCEAYGRYAPDFSFPLRSQSILLDGFKRVFLKSFKREMEQGGWSLDQFREQLVQHRKVLLMSQEYLVPLLIHQLSEPQGAMIPFFKEMIYFFVEEYGVLKEHIQKLLVYVEKGAESIESQLEFMVPLIKEDEKGVYFPFCYLLAPKYALVLKKFIIKRGWAYPSTTI